MKQNVKRLALLCAAASLILQSAPDQTGKANAAAAPAPAKPATLFTNAVVAKGKGVNITRNELDEEVIRVKSQFAAQGRTAMPPDADAAGARQPDPETIDPEPGHRRRPRQSHDANTKRS